MQYLESNRWDKRVKALEKIGKKSDLHFTFPGLGREYFSFDSSCTIDVQVLNNGIYFLIKFDMQTIKNFVISTIVPKEKFRLNSSFVKKFFKEGKSFILESKSLDKYGRTLAVVTNEEGICLNDELVKNHLAVAYHGQNKAEVQAQHFANRKILDAQ